MSLKSGGANPALVFAFGLLTWLLNHPYQGLAHDSRIYGLLAAHWLNPAAFADELFFSFGSQGAFSLFTPLFGMLVGRIGLDLAAWWTTLAGGLLWVGSWLALALTMLGRGLAFRFAVFLAAVVVVSYSPNGGIFVLGESFATARLFAIPLGLASVAALAAKRPRWSLGLALAAFVLHPLHGIWPLALWVLTRMRMPWALGLALLPLAIFSLIGALNPDLPHLRLMTGDWLEFARNSAPDIAFKSLQQTRLSQYSGVLVVLWLGARMGSPEWRGLYLRLLLLGVGGLSLALLASHAFPVEIVVQGQPWRVLALLIPLAAVALLDLSRRAWRASQAGQLLVAAAVVLAVMDSRGLLGVVWAMGFASLLPVVWIERIGAWAGRWRRWLGGALAAVALSAVPNILAGWEIAGGQLMNPWWTGAEWLHGLVAGNSWHLAALLALALGWLCRDDFTAAGERRKVSAARMVALAVVILVVAAALPAWDRRSAQYRLEQACYIDASCPPHPFRQWIAPGSTVFWPQRELTVWFEIGTANYFGPLQAIGRLFSSEKFYEWQRRQSLVAAGIDPRLLCADPRLDWVVLSSPVPGLAPKTALRYAHLYGCADFRRVAPAPALRGPGT